MFYLIGRDRSEGIKIGDQFRDPLGEPWRNDQVGAHCRQRVAAERRTRSGVVVVLAAAVSK